MFEEQPTELAAWVVPGSARGVGVQPSPRLQAVQQAVEALADAPVSSRPVDARVLLVLAERLRALAVAAVGELDATGAYGDDGAASAATWLRREQVLGVDAARATVRLAARLREDLPVVARAWQDGETTEEHVRALAAGTQGLDADLVAQAQEPLLDLVAVAEPAQVRRQLRERAEALEPALEREAERRQRARQGLFADAVAGGGGVVLGGSVCDEDGAVLLHGLDLAVQADRGDTDDDVRGLPARRAAVLVQWAREAATRLAGPGDTLAQDARTVRSHLLITCTLGQLQRLALAEQPVLPPAAEPLEVLTGRAPVAPASWRTGQPVLPEALRRLACHAALDLAVTDRVAGPVRPLYVGRSARTVTGAQLKALVVRDRHCVVKGCRRRPAQCEAHHVRHWLDGGPTDLDNLVLLCHAHHHDHHDRGHDLQHHDGRWLTSRGWSTGPPRRRAAPLIRPTPTAGLGAH